MFPKPSWVETSTSGVRLDSTAEIFLNARRKAVMSESGVRDSWVAENLTKSLEEWSAYGRVKIGFRSIKWNFEAGGGVNESDF